MFKTQLDTFLLLLIKLVLLLTIYKSDVFVKNNTIVRRDNSVVELHKINKMENSKVFAEFFAGIGLMRMGLENAGWRVAYANDIDSGKEYMYKRHFKDKENHFHLGDIHKVSGNTIPSVSLATASFPCTDLSNAGRREGLSGKQSSAFWGFVRILKEMGLRKPPIILLENVVGFLTSHGGADFKRALISLNELGYAVDAFIIDAAHFVPQSRVRLFIVGKLQVLDNFVEDKQLSFFQSEVRPKRLADFICNNPEINWNITDLPTLPKRTSSLPSIIENLSESSELWWSQERTEYLLNQTFERHRSIVEDAKHGKKYKYFTAFRRIREGVSMAEIRSDGIAGCLRTPKGGSAKQILIRAGKGRIDVRLLSPRECARLMGANNYRITGNINRDLFGFGDAVCVPVVTWIAENYLNPLIETIYEDSEMFKEIANAV